MFVSTSAVAGGLGLGAACYLAPVAMTATASHIAILLGVAVGIGCGYGVLVVGALLIGAFIGWVAYEMIRCSVSCAHETKNSFHSEELDVCNYGVLSLT